MHFRDACLKIDRAKKHIADLQTCVTTFFDTDRYRLIIEKNPKTNESTYRVEIRGEIPIESALIIGDSLHNLKSSLDVAFHGFVAKIDGTVGNYTRFPIAETREALIDRLAGGSVKNRLHAQEFILDTIKPYKAGNYPIWALHALNIADKHQLLIPLVEATELRGVDAQIGGNTFCNMSFGISGGRVISAIRASGADIRINKYGQVSGDIRFQHGQPWVGEPVVPSLYRITEEVTRTVEALKIFAGQG